MRPNQLPSLEVLNEWLYEEPEGVLRWRKDYRHYAKAGDVAGYPSSKRWNVSLHDETYYRSRLIYKMHKGVEPRGQVDHINHDTLDDRIENLRDVTRSLNIRNSKDRNGEYFYVTEERAGRSVRFNLRCWPEEDAVAIAKFLNDLTKDYLTQRDEEHLARPIPTEEEMGDRLRKLLKLPPVEPAPVVPPRPSLKWRSLVIGEDASA